MNQDKLLIGPITLYIPLGWHDEERCEPQRVIVDLEFAIDLQEAARTEDLTKTIDYGIAEDVKHFMEGRTYKLLETLAEDIATYCLSLSQVTRVLVRAQKQLPFDKTIRGIVEISRSV